MQLRLGMAIVVLFVLILVVGCGGNAAAPTAPPEPTSVPVPTATVEPTIVPMPTVPPEPTAPPAGTVLMVFGDRFIYPIYQTVRSTLENAGYEVVVASKTLDPVRAKDVNAEAPVDLLLQDVRVADYDAVIFTCDNDLAFGSARPETDRIAQEAVAQAKVLAAICNAPLILGYAGLVEGLTVTGEPSNTCGQLSSRYGANCTGAEVERDGLIITAKDRYARSAFVQAILEALSGGALAFVDSEQELGEGRSMDVALGDLDGDGDLDAFVGSQEQAEVWLNDGQGFFSPNGQDLSVPSGWNMGLDLGDLDGDGDLDAFVVVAEGPGRVLLNQGGAQGGTAGSFADSGQQLEAGSGIGFELALGDLDGDGNLDAYVAYERANRVWLNDGQGGFSDSGQQLGQAITADVALADLDGDGDLDALTGGWDEPARVWLNDGAGVFADSGHPLTAAAVHIHGLDVGDLDGDGDLDVFLATASGHPNQVWLNDGAGVFGDSGQSLVSSLAHDVVLADLDGDGDLDAFTANAAAGAGAANHVWLNDGRGTFADSGMDLGNEMSFGVALGDLDGDGDLDAFVANNNTPGSQTGQPNLVWLNRQH